MTTEGSKTLLGLGVGHRSRDQATRREHPSGAGTEGIAVSPDQREVWATNRGSNTASIIDIASSKIVATLDSKSFPTRARFTDDGKEPDGLGYSPLTL